MPIFRKEYIGGQGYIRGYSAIPSDNPMDDSRKLIEVDNFIINTFEIQNTIIKREEYINKIGLWHSIAHDKAIDENFVADLKLKIEKKYSNFKE